MSRPRLKNEREYETEELKRLQPWTDETAKEAYHNLGNTGLLTMANRWRETYSIAVNAIQERNKAELDLQREQSKISTSLSKLQVAEQDRDTCVREYAALQQKYRELLASGEGAQLAEATQRNAQLEAAIEQNRRASAQAQAKQAKLSRQNADLASQLQQAQELQTTNAQLVQQNRDLQLQLQTSRTQLEQQAQRVQELQEKNAQQKSILTRARESYRQLQANLSTCQADLQTLATIRADLDECNASLDARSKSEQELQQQVQALQSQLAGIQAAPDCSAQNTELATLRERLADFSAALNDVVRKVEQLVGRVPT